MNGKLPENGRGPYTANETRLRTVGYILAGLVSLGLIVYTVLVMYSVRLPGLLDGEPEPGERPTRNLRP